MVNHLGLVLSRNTSNQSLALSLWNSKAFVGLADIFRKVFPALGLLLGRANKVLDVVKIDSAEVRTPGWHWLLQEVLVALQATLQHPVRLTLFVGDVRNYFFIDAATS